MNWLIGIGIGNGEGERWFYCLSVSVESNIRYIYYLYYLSNILRPWSKGLEPTQSTNGNGNHSLARAKIALVNEQAMYIKLAASKN